MTRFSALVRWFKGRQTHLRDHRTLFRAAPRYAAVAGIAPMVVFLLYAAHGSWSLLLATSLLGSALLAASTYLVFMTVGSVEYDNEEYGAERLEAFLSAHADASVDDLVEALSEEVATYSAGREQSDDRAVLAFQVRRMVASAAGSARQ